MNCSILQNSRACKLCALLTEMNSFEVIGWLPKKSVMRFFDYGDTQMRQLEKDFNLEIARINSRKFYSVNSIINLLKENRLK